MLGAQLWASTLGLCGAGDQIQDLLNARQILYPLSHSHSLDFNLLKSKWFFLCGEVAQQVVFAIQEWGLDLDLQDHVKAKGV